VPWPFFQVIFDVTLPVSLLTGTVTFDVPPAFSPAGVHTLIVDTVVPLLPEMVVVDVSFEQTTLGVRADAGVANGAASMEPAAALNSSTRTEIRTFIDLPPES
jgi:hypothetical protein